KVDKYIIYVLDSVITASASSSANLDAVEVLKRLENNKEVHLNRYDDKKEKITVEPDIRVSCKDQWRRIVRNYITELARMSGVSIEKLNVVISSSIGMYNGWSYNSYPDLVTMELLDGLWRAIMDSVSENLTIILDTTHGINFMPVITMFISRLVASLALLKGSRVVTIKEYNAMPATWDYRKVFSEQIRFVVLPEEPINPVVKAYLMGMPIVVYKLCRLCGSTNKQCSTSVDMEINHENKIIEYKSTTGFKKYYECLLEGLICSRATNKLRELMKGDLFNKISEVSSRLINDELNNIYSAIRYANQSFNSDTLYASIVKYPEGNEKRGEESGDRFMRHAIAHAGLLKDYTVIKKCDDDYCIDVYDSVLRKLGLSCGHSG
ncbi:CRISPR-associated DxTHG motif protein, partial [Caldivirga sp. UBA161]|uniref:CRISPR-associated DxTHG motif protein n=1 Tax=Caldivirga sp. UBA161 TaxID=1915569 RepID=UPI0025BE1A02